MTRSADDLWNQFSGLSSPDSLSAATYSVGPATEAYRIGKNANGLACLLVKCASTKGLAVPNLRHLRISVNALSTVTMGAVEFEETFTIVEPRDVDPSLNHFLVGSFHSVMVAAGPDPTVSDLQKLLSQIAALFRGFASDGRATAQGLWAELLILSCALDPYQAAKAWHREFDQRWDFSADAQRVEVKSTTMSKRAHQFSLEQVCPPDGVYVCSVLVTKGGALSIEALVDRIRQRLSGDSDLIARVEETIAHALGSDAADILGLEFDELTALKSVRFYRAEGIPKPRCEQDPGVKRVKFASDLEFSVWLSRDEIDDEGGLVHNLASGCDSAAS